MMGDPERLLVDSTNEAERLLLEAGRVEAPPGARERAMLAASSALATPSVPVAGTAGSKGVLSGVAKVGSTAAVKWIGIVATTGIVVTSGASYVVGRSGGERTPITTGSVAPMPPHAGSARSSLGPSANPPNAVRGATVTPRALPSADWSSPSISVERAAAASAPRTRAPVRPASDGPPLPSAASSSTVPAELAVLDEARDAIGAGYPARALEVLDHYALRFPHGAMAPEGDVLRIEALVRAGDRDAATRYANAFLATHPDTPYRARVQAQLGAH